MSNKEIWIDIVIPLLSAFIGGFVTMLGVIITIRHDKKRERENAKQSVKPWIFSLNKFENYDHEKANDIYMVDIDQDKMTDRVLFVIKNTDNGICIIEKFKTKTTTYYPTRGNILDKNSITNLYINLTEEKETLKDMCLYVKDVYGTQYKYRAFLGDEIQGNHIEEIEEGIK